MGDRDLAATNDALVHVARMLGQTIQLATHCAIALEDAGKLGDKRARMIARTMKKLAQLLDDPDALEPGNHAQALHQIASMLEASHPTNPRSRGGA